MINSPRKSDEEMESTAKHLLIPCTGVAQASKPAVSPTSKSGECRNVGGACRFGNLRYGRLGSLRYVAARLALLLLTGSIALSDGAAPPEKPTILIVVGAPGEEEFGAAFDRWAGLWQKAGAQAGARVITVGSGAGSQPATAGILPAIPPPTPTSTTTNLSDKDRLQQTLSAEPKEGSELYVVLIGHGTFDGKEAKFNLRGPDFTATELADWLKPFHRPLAVIDTSSSSSPFISKLSGTNRIIITATRSGYEQNYARFGGYLAQEITDPEADLDKDGQTSLLEAFLFASRRVAQFYQVEGRLATEHPLLDDNGDGLGTPADWFRGIRATKKAKDGAALDGLRAHQFHLLRNDSERNMPLALRTKRDELELAVGKLREAKSTLGEDEYYSRLEPLMVEIARLYEGREKTKAEPSANP